MMPSMIRGRPPEANTPVTLYFVPHPLPFRRLLHVPIRKMMHKRKYEQLENENKKMKTRKWQTREWTQENDKQENDKQEKKENRKRTNENKYWERRREAARPHSGKNVALSARYSTHNMRVIRVWRGCPGIPTVKNGLSDATLSIATPVSLCGNPWIVWLQRLVTSDGRNPTHTPATVWRSTTKA